MGKKVVITGVPGVGKTTVIEKTIEALKSEGIEYRAINFGTCMFEVASSKGYASDRDEMRKLDQGLQREFQKAAASHIAGIEENVIVDTHSSVSTPQGYLAGLPEWVLRELKPDVVVLVEADEDQILKRRLKDASRNRDLEGYRDILDHQQFNRFMAASYSMMTGCTVKIIHNPDFLLEKSVANMAELLR